MRALPLAVIGLVILGVNGCSGDDPVSASIGDVVNEGPRSRVALTEHHADHGWLILKNADHVIGLFQGMFEKNVLTFNPGWDQNANALASYTDVRELQRALKAKGITFVQEADETTTGPASFVIQDPDGNPILVDQHV